MHHRKTKILILTLVLLYCILSNGSFSTSTVYGALSDFIYSVSFTNSDIQITTPTTNNTLVDRYVTLEGKTSLNYIFLCLRGPNGEISVYPVEDITNGEFKKNLWLRFGPGTYTIWAGKNDKQFDGSICFTVNNTSQEEYRYLTPSGYVNSDSPEIIKLANSLISAQMTDLEKTRIIHDYVANTVRYDYSACRHGQYKLNTATCVLQSELGVCRDYAFAFAALARAAGIPTKVIYGDALNQTTLNTDKHAWNEAYVDGKWINIDISWNAGYIVNDTFVSQLSHLYFNTPADVFARTHTVTTTTIF